MPSVTELEQTVRDTVEVLGRLRTEYQVTTSAVRRGVPGAQARRDMLFSRIADVAATLDNLRRRLRRACPECVGHAEHNLHRLVCDRHLALMDEG